MLTKYQYFLDDFNKYSRQLHKYEILSKVHKVEEISSSKINYNEQMSGFFEILDSAVIDVEIELAYLKNKIVNTLKEETFDTFFTVAIYVILQINEEDLMDLPKIELDIFHDFRKGTSLGLYWKDCSLYIEVSPFKSLSIEDAKLIKEEIKCYVRSLLVSSIKD